MIQLTQPFDAVPSPRGALARGDEPALHKGVLTTRVNEALTASRKLGEIVTKGENFTGRNR